MNTIILFSLLALIFSAPERAIAELPGFFSSSQTRLGIVYIAYSGEKTKSFGDQSVGYGAEVVIKKSTAVFSFVGKVRGIYTSGNEYFLDGSTQRQLSYTAMSTEALLGVLIHLIPSVQMGFRPYVGAAGGGGAIQLRFSPGDTTTLETSETSLSQGYELFVGCELNSRKAAGSNYWSLYGEFAYRAMTTELAGQSGFSTGGIMISGGIGW